MNTLKCNASGLSKLAGLSAIALIAVAGCGNKGDTASTGGEAGNTATGKSVDQNFEDTANAVAGAGSAVAGGVSNAVGAAGNVASNAGEAVSNDVKNAGNAVATTAGKAGVAVKNAGSAAANTPKIKAALGASAALKGSEIDVDSNAQAVTLKGTVKSAMQKSMAASIAKKEAGGLKIINNLTVQK